MSDTLPKFMFLHEDSEPMHDKRVQTITRYTDVNGKTEKEQIKRMHNTQKSSITPYNHSINNLGTHQVI